MLIHSLRGRGIGPLGDFSLDLAALPAGILVVRAHNGAGKSVLVGSIPGAFYREVPTKGPLAGLATARDSFLEVAATYRRPFTIRQSVDAVTGKGEALVLGEDGQTAIPSTKVTEADAWVAANLPPPEVYFAALFAPQQSAGFLDLSPGDRKGVILRVLGIEKYEALAEKARKLAAEAQERLNLLAAEIRALEPSGGPLAVASAKEALEAARKAAEGAEAELDRARAALDEAKGGHEKALRAAEAGKEAAERHRAAADRLQKAEGALRDARRRVEDAEAVAKARPEVDAARARVEAQATAYAAAEEAARDFDRQADEAYRGSEEARKAGRGAQDRLQKATARRKVLAAKMADRPRIEAAVAALAGAREAEARAREELGRAGKALDALSSEVLAGAGERIGSLRGGLERIEAGAVQTPEVEARLTLRVDDAAVAKAKDRPSAMAKARDARRAAEEALAAAQETLRDLEALAARQGEIDALDSEQASCDVAAEEAEKELEEAGEREKTLRDRSEAAREAGSEKRKSAPAPSPGDLTLSGKAAEVAAAEARLPDLRSHVVIAEAEAGAAKEALVAAPDPGAVPTAPDLSKEEGALAAAEKGAREAGGSLGRAEQALASAEETGRRIAAKQEEDAIVRERGWDATRLAQDLGRKGLQALEIDAAGPELTEIVNDLLRQAFGPRYTLTLETTRPRQKDGELVEVFDIRALDSENGWEGQATGLSGGQRTIVGEALRLALTTLACRRAGVSACTLVRDESGAALDQENAPAYVAMLRRAASLIGARQVLVVSHDPVIWSLADALIGIEGGKVVTQ